MIEGTEREDGGRGGQPGGGWWYAQGEVYQVPMANFLRAVHPVSGPPLPTQQMYDTSDTTSIPWRHEYLEPAIAENGRSRESRRSRQRRPGVPRRADLRPLRSAPKMTDLQKQLQRLKEDSGLARRHVRVRPSLLYDAKAAADIPADAIYENAVQALDLLCQEDETLGRFRDAIFPASATTFDRALLNKEENATLNKELSRLLRRLSPLMMQPPTVQILEFLVRAYSIQDLNAESFFAAMLPYHDESIFAKCIMILNLKRSILQFLEPIKRSGAAPPRARLVGRALQDTAFLRFVCENVQKICRDELKAAHEHRGGGPATGGPVQARLARLVSFFSAFLCEVIDRRTKQGEVDDAFLRIILPILHFALGCGRVPDLQVGSYMALARLSSAVALADKARDELITVLMKHVCTEDSQATLLCLSALLRDAPAPSDALPMSAFRHMTKVQRLPVVLAALSADHDPEPIAEAFYVRAAEAIPLHDSYASKVCELLSAAALKGSARQIFQGQRLTTMLLRLLGSLAVFRSSGGDADSEDACRRVVKVLRTACLHATQNFDDAVAAALGTDGGRPSRTDTGKGRRPRAGSLSDLGQTAVVDSDSGRVMDAEVRRLVLEDLRDALGQSLDTAARVPLPSSGVGLLVALESTSEVVRVEALKGLAALLANKEDAAAAAKAILGDSEALLRRLEDDAPSVATLAASPVCLRACVALHGRRACFDVAKSALEARMAQASEFLPTGSLHLTGEAAEALIASAKAAIELLDGASSAGDRDSAVLLCFAALECPWDAVPAERAAGMSEWEKRKQGEKELRRKHAARVHSEVAAALRRCTHEFCGAVKGADAVASLAAALADSAASEGVCRLGENEGRNMLRRVCRVACAAITKALPKSERVARATVPFAVSVARAAILPRAGVKRASKAAIPWAEASSLLLSLATHAPKPAGGSAAAATAAAFLEPDGLQQSCAAQLLRFSLEEMGQYAAARRELLGVLQSLIAAVDGRPLLPMLAMAAAQHQPKPARVAALSVAASCCAAAAQSGRSPPDLVASIPLLVALLADGDEQLRHSAVLLLEHAAAAPHPAGAQQRKGKRTSSTKMASAQVSIPLSTGPVSLGARALETKAAAEWLTALAENAAEMRMDASAVSTAVLNVHESLTAAPAPKRRRRGSAGSEAEAGTHDGTAALLAVLGDMLPSPAFAHVCKQLLFAVGKLPAEHLWKCAGGSVTTFLKGEALDASRQTCAQVLRATASSASIPASALDVIITAITSPDTRGEERNLCLDVIGSAAWTPVLAREDADRLFEAILGLYTGGVGHSVPNALLRKATCAVSMDLSAVEEALDAFLEEAEKAVSDGWLARLSALLEMLQHKDLGEVFSLVPRCFMLLRRVCGATPGNLLGDEAPIDAGLDVEPAEYCCRLLLETVIVQYKRSRRAKDDPTTAHRKRSRSLSADRIDVELGRRQMNLQECFQLVLGVSQGAATPALRNAGLVLLSQMTKADPRQVLQFTLPLLEACAQAKSAYDFETVKKVRTGTCAGAVAWMRTKLTVERRTPRGTPQI